MEIPWIFTSFHGDYFSDRLLRVYSTILFLIVSLVITLDLNSDKGMVCWVPAYFTEVHSIYTNNRCSRGAMLYTISTEPVSPGKADLQEFNLAYLRLFPVVLACQALLFLLPLVMWKYVSTCLCNFNMTIKEAMKIHKNSSVSEAASVLSSEIQCLVQPTWPLNGRATGGYMMTFTFLLMRLFYWIICFVQMAIISAYFHFNFAVFKLGQPLWQPYMEVTSSDVVDDSGNETIVLTSITTSTPFPKVVLCDFPVRQMGNIHRHTVQCNLNVADTVEDCLLVIWLWIIIVLIITSGSGVLQIIKTIVWSCGSESYKSRFLMKRLSGVEGFSKNSETTAKFAQEILKPDVMFLIGMVEEKGSVLVTRAALRALWKEFLDKYKIEFEHELTLKC